MNDERAIELFAEFRQACSQLDPQPKFAEFVDLPDGTTHYVDAMAFIWLAREQLRESANSVNEFALYLAHLRAWVGVVLSLDELERHEALLEFVKPLAYFCLNAPYAIKSRFTRSVADLSHQANRFLEAAWSDDADLSWAEMKTTKRLAECWPGWPALDRALAELDADESRERTDGFRNEFHHGFPCRIEFGQQRLVKRDVIPGTTRTSFGIREPLRLTELVDLLAKECEAALRVFEAYVRLVQEQYESVDDACRVDG